MQVDALEDERAVRLLVSYKNLAAEVAPASPSLPESGQNDKADKTMDKKMERSEARKRWGKR